MTELGPDEAASVRDALAVIQTSLHLLRMHVGAGSLSLAYLEKHFSRMEKSVERATVALKVG